MISQYIPAVLRQSRFWPTLRQALWPLWPGWVDEGRWIVQAPPLRELLSQAQTNSNGLPIVFNAGAGEGLFSSLLLELPQIERLIEADVSYSQYTRKRVDSRQFFLAASLTAIPLANKSIDLILCSEVLEHIDDDTTALNELQRILKPSGWLLISVPTPPAEFDLAHVREGYTPAVLTDMLLSRGVQPVAIRFCMQRFFRLILRANHVCRFPRGLVIVLSWLDRILPIGKPMDIIVLAQKKSHY